MLTEMKVNVTLAWIPSHQGIEFNNIADFLAKETACEIYKGRLSAPTSVRYNDAVRMSAVQERHGRESGIKMSPVFIPDS